jgi:hypothetical protein
MPVIGAELPESAPLLYKETSVALAIWGKAATLHRTKKKMTPRPQGRVRGTRRG